MPSAVAVLTAAGSGARLGLGYPKALAQLAACSLVGHAASRLCASGEITQIVVTAPREHLEAVTHALDETPGLTVPWRVVEGGPSRQASVAAGLAALVETMSPSVPYDVVLVHDAARPLASPDLVRRVVAAVRAGAGAVVPGLSVTDTVKTVGPVSPSGAEGEGDSTGSVTGSPEPSLEQVTGTVDRTPLRAVQTPQGFRWDLLLRAHAAGHDRAHDEATAATDDSSLVEALGEPVFVVAGEAGALKITTTHDLAVAQVLVSSSADHPADHPRGTS
ncbi:2-C-methyl-D-erythritol 4-phosphate cytidylyltransferase [Sanguibacter keddieii DSM 10542]|uniref:2-C-methyl-D-erythritol 4-phosphate cytidylyltransferase n=1 Tax=Sanguibacter keddieii (strain ATCC 51767 / DSM 10542 / NCFB 3025 / ST-74) TaxID=446469 RepID=D1BD73_SANKS|nr:IspD/TarI family cytidylyltransferase [Sanguibacter keddieii]ACZ23077.1 2-C-methyl-D-erythritol 4-phosphate cytidylyltransferase [Sanguibacter keddieii DSM 10542]